MFEARGQNDRQLEELADLGQGQNVVRELVGTDVSHQGQETGLVVDEEDGGLVLVQPIVFARHRIGPTGREKSVNE